MIENREERYWYVNDSGGLTWTEDPYSSLPDELHFEAEIIDPSYSLQQIAEALDAQARGEGSLECWLTVCRFKVYYESEDEVRVIAKVEQVGGFWRAKSEDDVDKPANRHVRRMVKRGCDHPTSMCIR